MPVRIASEGPHLATPGGCRSAARETAHRCRPAPLPRSRAPTAPHPGVTARIRRWGQPHRPVGRRVAGDGQVQPSRAQSQQRLAGPPEVDGADRADQKRNGRFRSATASSGETVGSAGHDWAWRGLFPCHLGASMV
ncbi:protein of unknown function [Micropruina glycogenica]|uniref:Uncharacterized protein n=1 Tax=Micropruina glycogenica TaxID=75385 RepID=A0A2N9JEC9_9ACTN|nr:protein of unknown function [Micropruina glycogenica]